jgi:beta-lactamase regulating signal transducer with metallopeptidase domain
MQFLTQIKGIDLILQFLIKSTFVLTFSFILIFFLKKKSATLKHFVLSVSLISLLLLPFFSAFNKGWETGLIPILQTEQQSSFDMEGKANKFDLLSAPNTLATMADSGSTGSSIPAQTPIQKSKSLRTSTPGALIGLSLLTIWSAGLIFLMARLFLGLFGAFHLTRQSKKISNPTWRRLLLHFLESISIKRKISLLSHKQVTVPFTWGVVKPVVILPSESKNWTKDQCSSALYHELSHIKRYDFLVKILARLSCALYWFNPLSWFAFRMIRKEQEKACDELVLKAGVKPSTYAVNLLSIKKAGNLHWNLPSAVVGAVGKSQLNERLTAILKQKFKPREVTMKTKIFVSSFIFIAIAFIGTARPSQSAAVLEDDLAPDKTVLTEAQVQETEVDMQEQQEKKKTEETAKKESEEKEKKTIQWAGKEGESFTIVIAPGKEGEEKTITVVGHPDIRIEKSDDKKTITLYLPNNVLTLIKDEKGCWTISSDKILMMPHKLNHAIKLSLDKTGKSYYFVTTPKIALTEEGKIDLHITEPELALHVAPHIGMLTSIKPKLYALRNVKEDQEKLEKKLKEITEKLEQLKEQKDLDQQEKEESLEEAIALVNELTEELKEKKLELNDIKIEISSDLKDLHIEKPIIIKSIKEDVLKAIKEHKKNVMSIICKDKEGRFKIIFQTQLTEENIKKYKEMVEKLKSKLPETCTVESKINEEDETITVTITGVQNDECKKTIKEWIKEIKNYLGDGPGYLFYNQ